MKSYHQQLNSLLNGPGRKMASLHVQRLSDVTIKMSVNHMRIRWRPVWPCLWTQWVSVISSQNAIQIKLKLFFVVSVITFIKMMWFTSYVFVWAFAANLRPPGSSTFRWGWPTTRGEIWSFRPAPAPTTPTWPHFSPIVFRKYLHTVPRKQSIIVGLYNFSTIMFLFSHCPSSHLGDFGTSARIKSFNIAVPSCTTGDILTEFCLSHHSTKFWQFISGWIRWFL